MGLTSLEEQMLTVHDGFRPPVATHSYERLGMERNPRTRAVPALDTNVGDLAFMPVG